MTNFPGKGERTNRTEDTYQAIVWCKKEKKWKIPSHTIHLILSPYLWLRIKSRCHCCQFKLVPKNKAPELISNFVMGIVLQKINPSSLIQYFLSASFLFDFTLYANIHSHIYSFVHRAHTCLKDASVVQYSLQSFRLLSLPIASTRIHIKWFLYIYLMFTFVDMGSLHRFILFILDSFT